MYIRVTSDDILHTKEKITSLFGEVKYLQKKSTSENEVAFITPVFVEKDIDAKIDELELSGANVIGKIRVLDRCKCNRKNPCSRYLIEVTKL